MDEMMNYLAPIFKWLSSGPVGIIAGIFGLGGILFAALGILKRVREAKFQGSLTENAQIAGDVSRQVTENLQRNTEIIDTIAGQEQKRLQTIHLKIVAPNEIKASEIFAVELQGVVDGKTYTLYADKKWLIGVFSGRASKLEISLTSAGKRTLDIKLGTDEWLSVPILVKE